MIIERVARGAGKVLATAGAAFGLWLAASAGILYLTDRAEAVLVVTPGTGFAAALPVGAGILEWDGSLALLSAGREGLVADLYASGALLVLPARRSGCMEAVAGRRDLR